MSYTKQRAGIILVGPIADRPAASAGEYWYFADDEGDIGILYHSDGATWTAITEAAGGSFDLPGAIHAAASKGTPVDADELALADSAASFGLKKLTWANLKATVKAYTDTLYPSGSGTSSGTNTGDQTSVSGNAGTATKLATARNIDGQAFDGSADITVIAPGTHAASSKTTPADADEFPIVDSAASNVLKKLTGTNLKAYLKAYFDTLYTGSGTGVPSDGWQTLSGLSYSSADAPTFVIGTSSDLSGTIPVGARIKLTQTTVKYFIVTAIDSTTITVYGGTDYTLANATIDTPFWSGIKVPFGFNPDPAKWTVTLSDTSDRAQANPTNGTWYNLGSLSIAIPIGCWRVQYQVIAEASRASAGACAVQTTLSTANNSASDSSMNCLSQYQSALVTTFNNVSRERFLTLASKTTYYLNAEANATGHNSIDFRGDVAATTVRAICAYL